MFVVLDTNHFTELIRESEVGVRLRQRLVKNNCDVFVTVITAHEALAGWLALINRESAGRRQVSGYLQFRQTIQALSDLDPIDFDDESAAMFGELKPVCPRLGTMDLKIASICLAHDALLLTRNSRDFAVIPGLRFENWLD
jgi:tRNA(fMet)-specific endonuclease VapC